MNRSWNSWPIPKRPDGGFEKILGSCDKIGPGIHHRTIGSRPAKLNRSQIRHLEILFLCIPPQKLFRVKRAESGVAGAAPFQSKEIGESAISQVAPAIANAVYDAVGVRIKDLPITAEKVYRALRGRESAQRA